MKSKTSPKKTKTTPTSLKPKQAVKGRSVKKLIKSFCGLDDLNRPTICFPILTVSEANLKEHWTKSAARHKKQKNIFKTYWKICPYHFAPPWNIQITRLAPRKLDERDNLPMSQKYIVDALCECLTGDLRPGRADADPRIKITYAQEKSKEYGVKVVFE